MTETRNVLLIVNPVAGKKRIRYELYGIIEKLESEGLIPTVYFTSYRGHAAEIARKTDTERYSMIICVGGDGTLNEAISGIMQSGHDIPLGYIPAGSTCDFASTIGLSKNMQIAATGLTGGELHRIDIGAFDNTYFSYVASFGIFTRASYSTNQTAKNLLGNAAYILEGIKDLGEVHEHHMRIELPDGSVIDDYFIFGAVANSTSIGGIISINPVTVALDDGEFEYLFVKLPANIGDLIATLDAISTYNYHDEHFYFGSAGKLVITSEERLEWSLDGERKTPESKTVEIRNIHGALSFIFPRIDQGRNLLTDK